MSEIIQVQDHRRVFIDTLIELAEKDERIVLIIPDVGFNYVEKFSSRFPDRFFNLGVTEQSCIMIATGMAKEGLRPFVYSMINFVLFRPGEMVRNGIVCHDVPVVLLGVKGSSSYKFLGFSHNLIHDNEDFDFCDNIGLTWRYPRENDAVRTEVLAAYESGKPSYIRL